MPSTAEIVDALDGLIAAAHRQRASAASTCPNVNATDLVALDIIRRNKNIPPGRLARELHLTPGGTNGVLRRLFKAEMIVRRVSPTDRRDVRLGITRRGAALMTSGVGAWDDELLDRLASLPEPAASSVMKALAAITASAEERATALAQLAAELHNPACSVPLPIAWG
jgi:DNA-binding MarR family transcriptional regulator